MKGVTLGREVQTDHTKVDIDKITIDDMPNEALREIFEYCGRDVAVSLMEHQNGVFIMMPAHPFRKLEQRLMIEEFNGTTASLRSISRKYDISEMTLRNLIRKFRQKK